MKTDQSSTTKWMCYILLAAALYNVLWGAWVVLFPNAYFNLAGMALPVYSEIWQCVGMIVGVYGIGYAIAARDPFRHWPIVLVGLLGKILGPIGFAKGLFIDGTFTWKAGLNIISNDLIWWVPFTLIILGAIRFHSSKPYLNNSPLSLKDALRGQPHNSDKTLDQLSRQKPLLICFLRHYG